jgi:hypothetical protein
MNRPPFFLLAAGGAILAPLLAVPSAAALDAIHAACWIGAQGRMEQLGFSALDATARGCSPCRRLGLTAMTTDRLTPLRIFHADKEYIQSITSLGYPLPAVDKLIELKVQGVDAAEVREIRGLGLKPNLDELVQMRILRITPDFVRRMQARSLQTLTIAELIQLRIFNLAD